MGKAHGLYLKIPSKVQMAIKVSLRKKAIAKERHSLYLDLYPAIINPETNEPTRREFLGYYIFDKPKTPVDKQHNKETLAIAEQIRQRRDNEINKPEIYAAYVDSLDNIIRQLLFQILFARW